MKKVLLISLLLKCIVSNAQNSPNCIIVGKLTHTNFKKVNIYIREDFFIFEKSKTFTASVNPDSSFIIKFYLDKPQPIDLNDQTVFAEPGDSINVSISGKRSSPNMVFLGDKSSHYNYFIALEKFDAKNEAILNLTDELPNSEISLGVYKKNIYDIYSKEKDFLEKYESENKCSTSFKNFCFAQLYYKYLSMLIYKYEKATKVVNISSLFKSSYFEGITAQNIQNDRYIDSWEYYNSLNEFVNLQFDSPTMIASEKLKQKFEFVKYRFKGITKDILLAKLFVANFNKRDQSYRNQLLLEYKKSKLYFFHKDYYTKLEPYYNKYFSYDRALSEDNITKLIDVDGKIQSLGQIISSNNGYVIYIDIWASWCEPCRDEIPFSISLDKSYNNKLVKFLYFSIDSNENAWKKAFKDLGINNGKSFLLQNDSKSEFAKNIGYKSIPRYLILDKRGHIVDADALRPSDLELKELLENYLNR